MAAYFIVDMTINDRTGLQEYVHAVPAIVQKYGGRYLVRGGPSEVVEGDWQPNLVVVLEFPSMERARAWYGSEEYKPYKEQRFSASTANIVLVDGVPA